MRQAIAAVLGTSTAMWLNAQDIYARDVARGARDVSYKRLRAGKGNLKWRAMGGGGRRTSPTPL